MRGIFFNRIGKVVLAIILLAALLALSSCSGDAAEVEVNANTVARSFDYLQTREIIFNKRGIGYFVANGAKDTIRTLRKKEFVEESLPELFRKMALLDISIDDVNTLYKRYCDNQID